eukprot:359328-Chlamydomonas_euryale.AAC.4
MFRAHAECGWAFDVLEDGSLIVRARHADGVQRLFDFAFEWHVNVHADVPANGMRLMLVHTWHTAARAQAPCRGEQVCTACCRRMACAHHDAGRCRAFPPPESA